MAKGRNRKGAAMLVQGKAGVERSGGGDWKRFKSTGQGRGQERPERFDVHEQVTARILERLEQGTVPWQSSSIARVGMPRNFSTGKAYSGINVFLLGMAEFQSPYFLTFLQAKELGGSVRKGEKGFPVVKAGTWEPKEDAAFSAPAARRDDEGESHQRRFLRMYTVFNSCQIDGIEFPEPPKCEEYTESQQAEAARLIVAGMPKPPAIFEGRKATPHYLPEADAVEMPSRETFRAEWRFYKTLFHELGHSTGHASRLNRRTLVENRGMFASGTEGRKIYCEEELVAEMTAAFLAAHAGIVEDGFENSAAYLKGWMDVLQVKDHKTWLVRAASEAQKAVDYVLGVVK
jgi:antirestriction protein ArdC